MSKLPSSKLIINTLLKNGFNFLTYLEFAAKINFNFISQRGSHCKYRKDDKTVIVPSPRKEIPIGTFRSILRQSGLSADDFK